jgi:hypothetical protein
MLDALKSYFSTLPINIYPLSSKLEYKSGDKSNNLDITIPRVTKVINKKTGVISLVINSIDSLYFYLLPLLDNNKMYSRKFIDFKL